MPEPLPEPVPEPVADVVADVVAAPDDMLPAADEGEDEDTPDEAAIAAMLANVVAAPPEGPDPLDRLSRIENPAEPAAGERSARPSLFGARRPAAPAAAAEKPAERTPRAGEPVTRMRAPAPRPAEPARPVSPSPDELASPRLVPMRERLAATATPDPSPPVHERRERPRIGRIVVSVQPPSGPTPASDAEQDVVAAAVTLIVARAADLAGQVDPEQKVPVDLVLEHCRDTIERVIAILARASSTEVQRIMGDLGEVQDLIMLMLLEKGHAPADDAITLLLQIRRELETLRAA
jgi:hypothetical protein